MSVLRTISCLALCPAISISAYGQNAEIPQTLPDSKPLNADRDYQFILGFHALGETSDERAKNAVGIFDRVPEWQSVLGRIDSIIFPWDCTATLGKENPDALRNMMGIVNSRDLILWADGRPMNRLNGRPNILELSAKLKYDIEYAYTRKAGGGIEWIIVDNYFRKVLPPSKFYKITYSLDQALDDFEKYVHITRGLIPGVKIAATDAIWKFNWGDEYTSANPRHARGDLRQILTELKKRNVLDALVLECAYSHTHPHNDEYNGFLRNKAIADWCQANGLLFGYMLEDNVGGRTSNKLFYDNVLKMYEEYKNVGIRPDIYFLLTWFPYPDRVLPETGEYTYMALAKELLDRIERDRPR